MDEHRMSLQKENENLRGKISELERLVDEQATQIQILSGE